MNAKCKKIVVISLILVLISPLVYSNRALAYDYTLFYLKDPAGNIYQLGVDYDADRVSLLKNGVSVCSVTSGWEDRYRFERARMYFNSPETITFYVVYDELDGDDHRVKEATYNFVTGVEVSYDYSPIRDVYDFSGNKISLELTSSGYVGVKYKGSLYSSSVKPYKSDPATYSGGFLGLDGNYYFVVVDTESSHKLIKFDTKNYSFSIVVNRGRSEGSSFYVVPMVDIGNGFCNITLFYGDDYDIRYVFYDLFSINS